MKVLGEDSWPTFLESWSLQLRNDIKMSPQLRVFFHRHIYSLTSTVSTADEKFLSYFRFSGNWPDNVWTLRRRRSEDNRELPSVLHGRVSKGRSPDWLQGSDFSSSHSRFHDSRGWFRERKSRRSLVYTPFTNPHDSESSIFAGLEYRQVVQLWSWRPKNGAFLQSTEEIPCGHLLKWKLTPENPPADTMFMAAMAMVLPWTVVEDFQSFEKNTKRWPSL